MDHKAHIARHLDTAARMAASAEECRAKLRTAVALQDEFNIEFYTARVEFYVAMEKQSNENAEMYARKLAEQEVAKAADFITSARATSEDALVRLEGLRLVNTIASHNHVVLSAYGDALAFDFVDAGKGKREATACRIVPLWKAPQFTKKDAQILAAAASDGNGKPGRAVFINDAVDLAIEGQREFQAILNKMEVAA